MNTIIIVTIIGCSSACLLVVTLLVLDFLDFRARIKAEEEVLHSRLAKRRARLRAEWNKTYGNN